MAFGFFKCFILSAIILFFLWKKMTLKISLLKNRKPGLGDVCFFHEISLFQGKDLPLGCPVMTTTLLCWCLTRAHGSCRLLSAYLLAQLRSFPFLLCWEVEGVRVFITEITNPPKVPGHQLCIIQIQILKKETSEMYLSVFLPPFCLSSCLPYMPSFVSWCSLMLIPDMKSFHSYPIQFAFLFKIRAFSYMML